MQDADRLDALGPVGIARMFSVGGQLGRALAHPTDPLAQQRPLDDVTYTLDHIEVKLATLPASMQTAAGRRLGKSAWTGFAAFVRPLCSSGCLRQCHDPSCSMPNW